MKCKQCNIKLKCIASRANIRSVSRRYKCPVCDNRFNTTERFESHPRVGLSKGVVKKINAFELKIKLLKKSYKIVKTKGNIL